MNGTQSLSYVTSRKSMHGQRSLLLRSSSVLLGVIGFDGKLKSPNSAWGKTLGHSSQELLDRPLRELMQHERPVADALLDQLLVQGDFEAMEFGLRCKDGSCKWFSWHRRFDPERQATFIAGHDITERKSREIASILRSYERPKRAGAVLEPGRGA